VTISSLDDPEQLAPVDQIWTGDRLEWMAHLEDLPCFSRSRIEDQG
jgi:hypothetical protein